MMIRTAWIDGDEDEYRYTLGRRWRESDPPRLMGWIMLNPSKADDNVDDKTIKRCMATASRMGFDGMLVANLFALRATDPRELMLSSDPIGPQNDEAIMYVAQTAEVVVAAWGVPKNVLVAARALDVHAMLAEARLHVMATSKDGHPRHPLYLPDGIHPMPWQIHGNPNNS